MSDKRAFEALELADEEWRDVVGFEGLYQVSSLGRVMSVRKGLFMKGYAGSWGYYYVGLSRAGKCFNKVIHRLVAIAFLGHPDGLEVNHKNGDKLDNRLSNLEWVTKSENIFHSMYVLGNLTSPIEVIDVHSGNRTVFPSLTSAAIEMGMSRAGIFSAIKRGSISSYGLRFNFLETPNG